MSRQIRILLLILFQIAGTTLAFAFDSENLVDSALEWGDVDPHTFMMHFQDGNILSLVFGIACAVVLCITCKRFHGKVKIALIVFVATLICMPIILMILGIGSNALINLLAISVVIVVGISLFIILPILLILWVYKLCETKNINHSTKAVWNLLISGLDTVAAPIVLGCLACIAISIIPDRWNTMQCERYVKERWDGDFYKVPELMYEWEKAHKLQWGGNEKKHYERREHPEPCDSVGDTMEAL